MVSVDTSNPNVRQKLEDGLDMAEEMLREKASFGIEAGENEGTIIFSWERSVALIGFQMWILREGYARGI